MSAIDHSSKASSPQGEPCEPLQSLLNVNSQLKLPNNFRVPEHRFGYHGGTFTEEEVGVALQSNLPLTIDISIPGKCLNSCTFCGYYDVHSEGKLTTSEILRVITDFADLGGRSVKILGEGEPMLRSDIVSLLSSISDLGMIPVLFSCGDVLGDDQLAHHVHDCSADVLIQQLADLDVTIMLKFELVNQDAIVRRAGYSAMRDEALKRMLRLGRNATYPTRLGFGTVLLKQNLHSIPGIYRAALTHNIYTLVCPLMPIGKVADPETRTQLAPTREETCQLRQQLLAIRKELGVVDGDDADFPGGLPCDISRSGMYMDDVGGVFLCESDDRVGSIREAPLKELWETASLLKDRKYGEERRCGYCFPKRQCGII